MPKTHHQPQKKVYLMILDGFGEGKDYAGNAITRAKTTNLNRLRKTYPWTLLKADGEAVGLPKGTQGGSEVGHFIIGSGRIIFQMLEEINRSIQDGTFFTKEALLQACKSVQSKKGAALHLLGMISDQGIHADIKHLFALLELAKLQKIENIFIHAITDGRDVPERTALSFIRQILEKIKELHMNGESGSKASIATIIGRYYAMDRDQNWDRTEKAYNLYTIGEGIEEQNPEEAIENAYTRGVKTDYYIDPIILDRKGLIKQEDAVIFWNFRTDRTRQITQCFTGEGVIEFKAEKKIRPLFVCFGDYSEIAPIVFPTAVIKNNLGNILEKNSIHQLRIAETEKYAHVTYFFNSQIEEPFAHETRIVIDSPKTPSYAQKPEMSAREVTNRVIKEMETEKYQVIIQNFANADLVGHSGDYQATVKAVEVLDECIGKIAEEALRLNYDMILTADHGNAEYMIYEENGEPCPSHTRNPVICMLIGEKYKNKKLKENRSLEDIAPTMLDMLDIDRPVEMTGKSLLDTK